MPVAHKAIVAAVAAAARARARSSWPRRGEAGAGRARRARAASTPTDARAGDRREPRAAASTRAIFLGNFAQQHPRGRAARTRWRSSSRDITGAHARRAHRSREHRRRASRAARCRSAGGRNAQRDAGDEPRRAYLVLHAEPELDCAQSGRRARGAREGGPRRRDEPVPARHATTPTCCCRSAPFTETAGTFVNCEGRAQSFNGVVQPLGETRPGWKVLRVLGTLLELAGFDADSVERGARMRCCRRRTRSPRKPRATAPTSRSPRPRRRAAGVERVADVPIYFADPLVRRSPPLQKTRRRASRRRARMHRALFEQLGLADGGAGARSGRAAARPCSTATVDAARAAGRACASPRRIRRRAASTAMFGPGHRRARVTDA